MIKYIPEDVSVTFGEVPDEIALCLNISNCQNNCEGCHSAYLKQDIGEELTAKVLSALIDKNKGITCVCFMGEGNDPEALKKLAFGIHLRSDYPYKVALYSGRDSVEEDYDRYFDYIKVGPYIANLGPLNKETTNQRLYEIEKECDPTTFEMITTRKDITYKFWQHE